MKKWISLLLIICFTHPCISFADGIHSFRQVTPLAKGVTLTQVKEFYADHNLSYSVVDADLTEKSVHFSLLTPKGGIDTTATVSDLASSEDEAVAALNADFFSVTGTKALSLGIEIKDGQLLQSPIYPETMATISALDDVLSLSYLDFHIMAVAPNQAYQAVRHVNKHTSYYGDILLYTSVFNGGYSPAPGGEVVEVVVENGLITEFRRNMPPVKIPKDGCVLVVSEGVNMFFSNNFSVGDPIRFDYSITPDISGADTALGGGAMLVENGRPLTDFSHVISGYNPRSALGLDKSGTHLYLVAVDGRQEQSRGMTMSELAALMAKLGCDSAVNLDGGGSTNMVASDVWQKALHTVNSPTENRRVINAAAIRVEGGSGKPDSLLIKSDVSAVFLGQTATISAVALDNAGRPCNAQIHLSASCGTMDGAVFTAREGGTATVSASCGNLSSSIELTVIDRPSGIVLPSCYSMEKGATQMLSLTAFDEKGRSVLISNFTPFSIHSSDPSVVSVSSGRLTAHKDGRAIITVSLGNAASYTAVTVGESTYSFSESFEEEDVASFASYPAYVGGGISLTNEAHTGDFSLQLSYDFTAETEDTQAAYAVLRESVPLADSCQTISMYCYATSPFLHNLKLQFSDASGNVYRVNADEKPEEGVWKRLTFTLPEDRPQGLSLTRLYAVALSEEMRDEGTVLFDDLSFYAAEAMKVPSLPQNKVADLMSPFGETSLVVGLSSPEDTLIAHYGNVVLAKRFDEAIRSIDIASTSYTALDDGNILSITLNTKGGGLRKSDASQWTKMTDAISQSHAPCLVLCASSPVFGEDRFENDILRSYLSSLSKTVIVITPGERNSLFIDNGVRYVTLAPLDSTAPLAQRTMQFSCFELSLSHGFSYRFLPFWP